MGEVYAGYYNSLKIAKKDMKNFDKEAFKEELQFTHNLRNIRSPTVFGVHKTIEKNERYSILMEFVDGKSLNNLMAEVLGKVEEPEKQLIFILYAIELAKGIDYISKRKVIHRDIKPDNVMISNSMELKIIDFGIAKEHRDDFSYTQTSQKGTMLYSPPENVRDKDLTDEEIIKETETDTTTAENPLEKKSISTAFDIWSYGLVISEMFGYEKPWKGYNVMAKLVLDPRYPIPNTIKDEIFRLIIECCTRIYPGDRINTEGIIKILITLLKEKLIAYSKMKNVSKIESKSRGLNLALKIKECLNCKENLPMGGGDLYIGNLFKEQGELEKAKYYYDKVISKYPENFMAYNYLGKYYEIKAEFSNAFDCYIKSDEISHNRIAINNIGNLFNNFECFDKAERIFNYTSSNRFIEQDNILAESYYNLGKKYEICDEDFKKTENYYQLSLKNLDYMDQIFVNKVYSSLGLLYEKKGNVKKAEKFYKMAINLKPHDEQNHLQIANLYYNDKNQKEAEINYKKANYINKENDKTFAILSLFSKGSNFSKKFKGS